jgi:hypothetical protein
LGVYPPGCLVLLNTGEIGVVTEVDPECKLRPKIIVVLDEDKRPCEEKPFDLAKQRTDAKNQPYVIRSVVRAEAYNIDINRYRAKGIFMMRN